ncbi:MAG: response regulator [Acidobacteriota bacterium]
MNPLVSLLLAPPARHVMVVLFVEDSDFYQQFRRGFFGRIGCQILNARSVAEAEEILAEEKPDLIVVSYLLPDGSGADLCRRLASSGARGAPRILITSPEDAELGAAAWDEQVTRPVDPDDLMQRISRILGVAQRSAERVSIQVEVVYGSRRDQVSGTCQNLSPDGMLVVASHPLNLGTRVEIQFKLPGGDEPLRAIAEVIRHTRLAGKDRHALGFRFADPDPSLQEKIKAILV